MSTRVRSRLLLPALALSLLPAAALAYPITWEIDETASALTLNVPDQNVTLDGTTVQLRLRNANNAAWTQGKTAAVDGTLATDYVDGTSIQFLAGAHDAFGLSSGSFRPNPAAFNPLNPNADNPNGQYSNTTTAPAVYAAKVRALALGFLQVDLGFVSFLDVDYDLSSGVLPIGVGGAFAGNALTMGVDLANIAFDGQVVSVLGSQPVPDNPGTLVGPYLGLNTLAGATVTAPDPINNPLLRRISIPVNLPLSIELEGVPVNATATGSIVAFALIPEPGTLVLLAGGLAGLAALRRRSA